MRTAAKKNPMKRIDRETDLLEPEQRIFTGCIPQQDEPRLFTQSTPI